MPANMSASMTLAETAYLGRSRPYPVIAAKGNRCSRFLVACLAVIALVASASPARAERQDDVVKALAAIAAIAVIASVAKDKQKNDQATAHRGRVPGICAIEIGSGRGTVIGYAERCLREEGFAYRLPGGCATPLRIYGRADRFYSQHCLREAGYTFRRR